MLDNARASDKNNNVYADCAGQYVLTSLESREGSCEFRQATKSRELFALTGFLVGTHCYFEFFLNLYPLALTTSFFGKIALSRCGTLLFFVIEEAMFSLKKNKMISRSMCQSSENSLKFRKM